MSEIDQWIDIAKQCKYLPENDLKVTILAIFTKSCINSILFKIKIKFRYTIGYMFIDLRRK